MNRIIRRVLIPVIVVGVLVGSCEAWLRSDRLEVYPILSLPGSDWVIEGRDDPWYLGGSVLIDVRARNTRTNEVVVIAEGDDAASKIVNDRPDHVTIRLPNWTVLQPVHRTFGLFRVDFEYQPKDEPESRAAYQRWSDDGAAPDNVRWYCTHVMAGMDKTNYERFDRILADRYFKNSDKKLYCD